MDQRFRDERITMGITGLVMVLAVSEMLIRSACLGRPGIVSGIWALGFGLFVVLPGFIQRRAPLIREQLMGTAIVLGALGLSALPLAESAAGAPAGTRLEVLANGIGQSAGYLAGSVPVLSDDLQVMCLHWICGSCVLLFLWLEDWKRRNLVLGTILIYGCVRWYQYVPELDGALVNLVLAWCVAAAVEGNPPTEIETEPSRRTGRLIISLFLAMGVFVGSTFLSAVFPLDALNRWAGGVLPTQDIFRNDYTKYGQTGFLLENTEWHPLGERLGGAVTLKREPVMEVRSSRPGLYLRGTVKTVYTGQAWETEPMDLEPLSQLNPLQGNEPFVLTIHPFDNRNRTVFAPLHTDRVQAGGREIMGGKEDVYRLAFKWFPEKQSAYLVEGYLDARDTGEEIEKGPYLQLPDISLALRGRVVEIAGETGTDAEKMQRLVSWLSKNGVYRLDVGEPAANGEFVEQFVLGSREGYCTYFATALAVMGRVSGIPTRYVEGYLLPAQTSGRQTYIITSDRAHAWVEAFIEGKGWTLYEATPSIGTVGNVGPLEPQQEIEATEADAAAPETDQGIQENEKASGVHIFPLIFGSGILFVILIGALQALWVESRWRRGCAGTKSAIWGLYAVLSGLTLILPTLKEIKNPTEKLKTAMSIFPFRAFDTRDIIEDTNRLLYGNRPPDKEAYKELLPEIWRFYRHQHGTGRYLYIRYVTLDLFNSYTELIKHRKFRKEDHHGADQPHASPQP